MRRKRQAGRDIGEIPKVFNRRRRARGRKDLKYFLRAYFPMSFTSKFSKDHETVIEKTQHAVLSGGSFAMAMPRGSGKTTISERAALWAIGYGHSRYAVVIGSDQGAAQDNLESIKTEIESNERLREDFPEICVPVIALDGISQRVHGQLCCGVSTAMEWKVDKIVIPTTPNNKITSGSVIEVFGLKGGIRGTKHTLATGGDIRPDFVILDDPQTDESAKSPSQCNQREKLIRSAVLGLAGPQKSIAAVMPCTIICENDLAARFLDTERNPAWRGERMKLIYAWPKNTKLWEKYTELRKEELLKGDRKHTESNKFYRKNRKAMDEGALPAWPERKKEGEISAVQNVMNERIRMGEEAFAAEMQNEPIKQNTVIVNLTQEMVTNQLNGYNRGEIPQDCHHIVAGIDINLYALSWVVMACRNDFTCFCIDYGLYPGRNKRLWTEKSKATKEQAIFTGLHDLCTQIVERYPDNEVSFLIDGNFCTTYVYRAINSMCRCLRGRFVAARGRGAEHYRTPRQGDRNLIGSPGDQCHFRKSSLGNEVPFNSSYWHMKLQEAFQYTPGSQGSVSLFGNHAAVHTEFAEQLTSEKLVDMFYRHGEARYKWTTHGKNDIADASAMCLVGASLMGASFGGNIAATNQPKPNQQPRRRSGVQWIQI